MKKGKLIIFSGLDCSGKSTQIDFLNNNFIDKGEKCIVFWSRGGYTPNFQRAKDIIRYFAGKKLPKPGFTPQREKALANPFIRKVWLTIAMLDLIIYYAFYLRLKYYLNYIVICDRHLIDTNIDFKLTYPQEKTNQWLLWKLLCFTALKPEFHFVSLIPVSESVIRSKFKFEPYPDSPEILSKRLDMYSIELAQNKTLIYVDGTKDMHEIKNFIQETITSA